MPTNPGVWEGWKFSPPGAMGTTKEVFNAGTLVSGVVIMPYLVNSG